MIEYTDCEMCKTTGGQMACPIHSQPVFPPVVPQQPTCFPPPCPLCEHLRTRLTLAEEVQNRYRVALEKIASGSDLKTSRIQIAREALGGHKPGCPMIPIEGVPKKYGTYCTCS